MSEEDIKEDYWGKKGVKRTMCWRQEGKKVSGVHTDKRVQYEKTRRIISVSKDETFLPYHF